MSDRARQGADILISAMHMDAALPNVIDAAHDSLNPDMPPLPVSALGPLRKMGHLCLEYGQLFIDAASADEEKRAKALKALDTMDQETE